MGRPFSKVLVANRGEIAVRVIRACREAGLATVAVHSEADARALHARLADVSTPIGPAAARQSYLSIDNILDAARRTGADAIHPGYGFLSENADFAAAVRDAGLVFIGPSPEAIRAMGDKAAARAAMQAAGVPVVPGYQGSDGRAPSDAELTAAAPSIGYPLLVKASAGGGGRGMRVVEQPGELPAALAAARREALHAFGSDTLLLERYVPKAHHIEFQIFGDGHGAVVHLLERECSAQRRHQKVVEESPSPLLDDELRERMGAAAVSAARAAGYSNAGTVEFIVDPATREFFFLEMNTRLQVEHPVTESVTGLDLVRLQLRVAAGEPLPFAQRDVRGRGHAIECRLYAEDPASGFMPSAGPLLRFRPPSGPGIRVDAGYEEGDAIGLHYDSMLAKLIVTAENRGAAVERALAALEDTAVIGPVVNLDFLRWLVDSGDFRAGRVHTTWIEEHLDSWKSERDGPPVEVMMAAAALLAEGAAAGAGGRGGALGERQGRIDAWALADGFRAGGPR